MVYPIFRPPTTLFVTAVAVNVRSLGPLRPRGANLVCLKIAQPSTITIRPIQLQQNWQKSDPSHRSNWEFEILQAYGSIPAGSFILDWRSMQVQCHVCDIKKTGQALWDCIAYKLLKIGLMAHCICLQLNQINWHKLPNSNIQPQLWDFQFILCSKITI